MLSRHGRVLVHARDDPTVSSTATTGDGGARGLRWAILWRRSRGLGAKKFPGPATSLRGRRGIEHASIGELREVPGIGKAMAERIHGHLNG
ncbi:MAG: hypothetical protein Ct9H300mP30_1470 [Methanobacteriota archaeon]|nr:MAG: hypothetical protein Ct9H300mP30_1470 [Euryarchaeota archaeon]